MARWAEAHKNQNRSLQCSMWITIAPWSISISYFGIMLIWVSTYTMENQHRQSAKSVFTHQYDQLRAILIDARKSKGFTQTKLAKQIGRPQSFVSKYELGERRLDIVELMSICKVLGIDAGNIVRSIDDVQKQNIPTRSKKGHEKTSILDLWQIDSMDLTYLVNNNPSLRGMLLGYVAELKLQHILEGVDGISSTIKHDDHNRKRKSDRVVIYKNMNFSVESKSLQTHSIKKIDGIWEGRAQVDGSDRRVVTFSDGSQLNTTLLLRGEFDILAVNCFAFEHQWHFVYALNRDLPKSTYKRYSPFQQSQLIASLVRITWPPSPPFVSDPTDLLEKLYQERISQHEGS